MSFDLAQLGPVAPLLTVIVGGLALLLLEAFAGGRSRGYLMLLTLATCGLALALEVPAWQAAGPEGGSTAIFSDLLRADRLSIFFGCLFLLNAALVALLAPGFLRAHGFEFGEFYPLVLFATAGMMILAQASDLVTIFLGIETMSIAVYVLTGSWRRSPRSSEAAMKYFLVGALAAAVLLYGITLVYGATGSTSLRVIAQVSPAVAGQPLFLFGVLLILGAIGFKVAAVPFHMWAPDAYEGAPTPVTAFMAAGVKAAGFAAALRLFGGPFARNEVAFGPTGWANIFAVLSVATMTLGNLAALRQDNVKRMLAYSSIAHAGYLLIGVVATATVGASARGPVLFYLVAYTFTTIGSFGVVAWLGSREDERLDVNDWAGLGAQHPSAALAMTIFLLSLAGIPPTAGFFGKFYLFRAALERSGLTWLVVIAVLNSVVSVYYYLRLVTAMYFREPGRAPSPQRYAATTAALVIAALAVLGLGLFPGWLAETASAALLG